MLTAGGILITAALAYGLWLLVGYLLSGACCRVCWYTMTLPRWLAEPLLRRRRRSLAHWGGLRTGLYRELWEGL